MYFTEPKSPAGVVDWSFDWSNRLADGETISSSDWSAPDGITIDSDEADNTTTAATFSGGIGGIEYLCVNTVVTSAGRTFERQLVVVVNSV